MARHDGIMVRQLRLIGCCGANCATCRSLARGQCRGCRVGYDDGSRRLGAAKCEVKRCCLGRTTLMTCADCDDYPSCERMEAFHRRKESKERSYNRPADYIRKHGYAEFLKASRGWKGPFGGLGRFFVSVERRTSSAPCRCGPEKDEE